MGANAGRGSTRGLSLDRYKLGIYTLSGAAAGLVGVLLTARTTSGQPASGSQGLELEAITAAVLGGAALSGGKGTVFGALLGVFVIGTLNNGMILLNVPSFYQLVAKGLLLVFAVVIVGAASPAGPVGVLIAVRITSVSTLVVNARLRNWVFVRVETDQPGLIGWGEASLEWKTRAVVGRRGGPGAARRGRGPAAHRAPLAGHVPPAVLPGRRDRHERPVRHRPGTPRHQGQGPRGAALPAAGRAASATASGCTTTLAAATPTRSTTGNRRGVRGRRPAERRGWVRRAQDPGRAAEPSTGRAAAIREAVDLMAAVREAVGEDVDVMIDLHGRTTPAMGDPVRPRAGAAASLVPRGAMPPGRHRGARPRSRGRVPDPDRGGRAAGHALGVPRAVRAAGAWRSPSRTSATPEASPSCARSRRYADVTYVACRCPAQSARPDRHDGQHPPRVRHAQPPGPGGDALGRAVAGRGRRFAAGPGTGRALPPTRPGIGIEVDEAAAARHPYVPETAGALVARRRLGGGLVTDMGRCAALRLGMASRGRRAARPRDGVSRASRGVSDWGWRSSCRSGKRPRQSGQTTNSPGALARWKRLRPSRLQTSAQGLPCRATAGTDVAEGTVGLDCCRRRRPVRLDGGTQPARIRRSARAATESSLAGLRASPRCRIRSTRWPSSRSQPRS